MQWHNFYLKVDKMRVKELRKILSMFDDETVVLMPKDDEGNAFRHVDGIADFEVYEKDGEDLYKADVPEDVNEPIVAMIWPGY